MRSALSIRIILGFLILSALCPAETPVPPAPKEWVTDTAGFLSAGTRTAVNARLQKYESLTGRQIVVWIGQTTGDAPLEDWTVRAFQAWKVGRKGMDDGAAFFLFTEDRTVRIEVGYGLEPLLTDALASRIIQESIIPRIRAGDPDGAVKIGVERILSTLEDAKTGKRPAGSSSPSPRNAPSPAVKILVGVAVILFLALLLTKPRLALYLFLNSLNWSQSNGSGGKGFRAGGGRSGGGGASGRW
jgi:uncharacterized protein